MVQKVHTYNMLIAIDFFLEKRGDGANLYISVI